MIDHDDLLRRVKYDPETGVFTARIKARDDGRWKAGRVLGSTHLTLGYVYLNVNKKRYLAHRLAWFYVYGEWPDGLIDHENGDRSDNRLCNLRVASHHQNRTHTTILRSSNTTGVQGVCWCKRRSKWYARIKTNGKYKFLGYFSDLDAAKERYDLAAARLFGEFMPGFIET